MLASAPRSTAGLAHLVSSMNVASKFVGTSRLEAVTCRRRGPGEPDAQIQINIIAVKITCFHRKLQDRQRISIDTKHMFSLEEFESLRQRPDQPYCWHLLDDLMYRRTDLAARLVA